MSFFGININTITVINKDEKQETHIDENIEKEIRNNSKFEIVSSHGTSASRHRYSGIGSPPFFREKQIPRFFLSFMYFCD